MGGVDLVAVLTARMKGWATRTFPEKSCFHHRDMGTATQSIVLGALKGGRGDYILGGDPVWEVLRCIYQMTRKPILIGGSLRLAGFIWAMVTRLEKVVPPDFVRFRRTEQMRRLRNFIKEVAHLQSSSSTTAAARPGVKTL
jgi:biofilm PGA synthesis N-glycosyltransferase PgaC